MMTDEQTALWRQLSDFSFDRSGVVLPFSHRLARENQWPLTFTRRVVNEYRRFLFLGAAAGHPVSPSEAVDQAWHLHMTYTKSYWNDLCRDTLRYPFHHEPTEGGPSESAKFDDWYAKTLASYSRLFEQDPPGDIWPTKPTHGHLVWVDMNENWSIRKPRWLRK